MCLICTFIDTVSGLGLMAWKTFLLCPKLLCHTLDSVRYSLCLTLLYHTLDSFRNSLCPTLLCHTLDSFRYSLCTGDVNDAVK
jgi:hypothetical protein